MSSSKYWYIDYCHSAASPFLLLGNGTINRIVEPTWGLVALHEVEKTVDAKIARTLRHELHSLVLYDYDDDGDDDWNSDVNDDVNDAKMDVIWSKYWNRSEPAMGLGGREAQLQGERGFLARRSWSSCTGASPWSKSDKNPCNDDIDDEEDVDDNGESDDDSCDGNKIMVRAIMMLVMEIMTMLTSSNTGTEKLLQQKDTCANLCQVSSQ